MEPLKALERIVSDDAVGGLIRGDGAMARLGSEDGVPKLDWVEGVLRILEIPDALESVEADVREIYDRGIRHVIWSGMGGSVLTVRVLRSLFGPNVGEDSIAIHPLDSTDPAALNAVLRALAQSQSISPSVGTTSIPGPGITTPDDDPLIRDVLGYLADVRDTDEHQGTESVLRGLLGNVSMVGVSMGMTSEEPITHLEWFIGLLKDAGLPPEEHVMVMTLPGSYLDRFAEDHALPRRPLQLDGRTGTGGRMSAPTTRVFLFPAAIYLSGSSLRSGRLREILKKAWEYHNLADALRRPAEHPFVRLAASLAEAASEGACRLLLNLSEWNALIPWIEQLMEESLGKDGKGIMVFTDEPMNGEAPCFRQEGTLRVEGLAEETAVAHGDRFLLVQPYLCSIPGYRGGQSPRGRPSEEEMVQILAVLAASFMGWQLAMALYGYLFNITFAGQPAVENYKSRARTLREQNAPLDVAQETFPALHDEMLTMLVPTGTERGSQTPASAYAAALLGAAHASDSAGGLDYLDMTINGLVPAGIVLGRTALKGLASEGLGIPYKLRVAPAAYHSTEQSEMDGPPRLVSLRLVTRRHDPILRGDYNDRFLQAQAVATWQAMVEAGRPCFLLILDGTHIQVQSSLVRFFEEVLTYLKEGTSTLRRE